MNVTCLVDTDGAVVERYMYDPYGKVSVRHGVRDAAGNDTSESEWDERTSNTFDNEILYCGYRYDSETGLYHVRWRMYHPTLGRWLQRDPQGTQVGQPITLYPLDGSHRNIGGEASQRRLLEPPLQGGTGLCLYLYQYCDGNPLLFADPSGLMSLTDAAWAAIGNRPAGILHDKYTPGLMLCLLWKESSFNEQAVGPTGDKGIAQFIETTADDVQDRVTKRFGVSSDPFYILEKGQRFKDHRFNPHVSIYAAYLYLEDRRRARGGAWKAGVRAYGPNGNKVIECAESCPVIGFDKEGKIKDEEELWKSLHLIHKSK